MNDDRASRLVRVFHQAPLAKTMGMRLHYEGEQAVFDWQYDPRFDHAMADVHGGVIATLLDNAGFFAAALNYEHWIVTVEFHTRLLARAGRETLRAVGRVVRSGKRMATTEMTVHNTSDELVALGSASFLPTTKPLPDVTDLEHGN